MSGTHIEQILGQTRRAVAISGLQVFEIAKMPQGELCALLVVLSRWYASSATHRKVVSLSDVPSVTVGVKPLTPVEIYSQLKRGDQMVPDQLAAIRSWSVPRLIAFVVRLQADLVQAPAVRKPVQQLVADAPRAEGHPILQPGRRRRSRRIVRERWLGAAVAGAVLIAMPILGETQSGRDVIQVSLPFLLGAASLWVFNQGRWMSQSRNPTKSSAGSIAVSISAIGALVAGLWILTEMISLGISIGEDILRYAAAM